LKARIAVRIIGGEPGLRGMTANIAGCAYITFTVSSDQPIEYVYLKPQFPANFKMGFRRKLIPPLLAGWRSGCLKPTVKNIDTWIIYV